MTKSSFRLSRVSGMSVSTNDLLSDMRKVAKDLNAGTVPEKLYRKLGLYDDTTFIRRFGSWNKALLAAGLSLSNRVEISDQVLFDNMLVLWQHYGRQPRRRELLVEPSTISQTPYNRRFGSWTAALEAFIEFINSSEVEPVSPNGKSHRNGQHRTPREASLRLRWHVLQRDRFTCRGCGASPATEEGVRLHVDHIIPWSKYGETVIDNLQTLCDNCNLGKSNVVDTDEL